MLLQMIIHKHPCHTGLMLCAPLPPPDLLLPPISTLFGVIHGT